MSGTDASRFREASPADVPAMEMSRADDAAAGPADRRMAAYMEGRHHPGHALAPRVVYVALEGDDVIGYIGGHLTTRYDCDGELQYLYVRPEHRRRGVAAELLRLLATWFGEHDAARVCVDVVPDNRQARAFYHAHGATELAEYWLVWEDIGGVLR